MNRRAGVPLRCLLLIVGWLPCMAAEYELVERDRLATAHLSEVGRLVAAKSPGVFGSNAFIIAHAAAPPELSRMIKEAEFARKELERIFGPSEVEAASPIFIAAISDPHVWDEIIRTHGLRRDGLAMRLGREIYFEGGELPENRPDRIMHEMVHVRTGDDFNELPHALDEGLAAYLGWTLAARYQAGKNLSLVRQHPALAETDLYTLPELLAMRDYPRGPARIRAFYRQSELLIEQLVERKGLTGLKAIMLHIASEPDDPPGAFREASGIDPDEEADMMQAIKDEILAGSAPVP